MSTSERHVEALMDIEPIGTKRDEVGRDPALDDELAFDHGDVPVVGRCVECGRDIHEGVTGHVCEDGYRDHRDGEGIREEKWLKVPDGYRT